MKFGFIDQHRNIWPVRVMCSALGLSASCYYAWRSRPESQRACNNRMPLEEVRQIHAYSSGTYGSPRVLAAWRLPRRPLSDRASDARRGTARLGRPATRPRHRSSDRSLKALGIEYRRHDGLAGGFDLHPE
jgi:putative transposase